MKVSKVFFTILFLYSANASAQSWTLQQCIDRALQYNIQIKQSSLNNDLNDFQVTQNTAAMFPDINGNASQNHYWGRSIDPTTNIYTTQEVRSNTFSLSGNLLLFNGLQLQNNLKESKLNYLSSQNDLKKIQNDISINVVNNYLAVLFNDELLKVAKDQLDATGNQRDRTKRMYEVGSVSKGAYLDLESQYAGDEVKLIQAQSQLDQSILDLTQLIELDTVKNFTVVKPDVAIPPFDSSIYKVDDIYMAALRTQPEIRSADYKVMSAQKGLASARGGVYPRLYLGGTLSTNYSSAGKDISIMPLNPSVNYSGFTSGGDSVFSYVPRYNTVATETPFRTQIDNNLSKSVGLTLQVPIFNGWSVRNNIHRAKINLEQNKLTNELTKKTLFKSVQQAVADAVASFRKYNSSERSVAAMEESFNYSQQRLDLGLISTYDYLLAKNNLANAKANLLQAKYEYIFKLKIIDFYQGKPLSF